MTNEHDLVMSTPAASPKVPPPLARVPRSVALFEEAAVGVRAIRAALAESGSVLVSDCTPEDFLRITDAVGSDYLVHPSRVREKTAIHPSVQTVERGNLALQLHCEMGYLPAAVRPRLACFFCVEPAVAGGATTLADAGVFARRLSPSTRRLFERERLLYRHRIPLAMYEALREGLGARVLAAGEGEHLRVEEQETEGGPVIVSEYATSAFQRRPGAPPLFSNSILASLDPTNSEAYRLYTLTLESGRPIPDDVVAELRAIAAEITVPVHWRRGDLVVLDNARVLHGRTAFEGPRSVWARFGDDRGGSR